MDNKDGLIKVNGILIPSSEEKNLPLWKIALGEITKKNEIFEVLQLFFEKNIITKELSKGFLEGGKKDIDKEKLSDEIMKNISINPDGSSKLKDKFKNDILKNLEVRYIKKYSSKDNISLRDYDNIYERYIDYKFDTDTGYIFDMANKIKINHDLWNLIINQLKLLNLDIDYIYKTFKFIDKIGNRSVGKYIFYVLFSILIEGYSSERLPISYSDRDRQDELDTIKDNYNKIIKFTNLKDDYEKGFIDVIVFYIYNLKNNNIDKYIRDGYFNQAGNYMIWINAMLGFYNILGGVNINNDVNLLIDKLGIKKYFNKANGINKEDMYLLIDEIYNNIKKYNLYDESRYADIIK